MATSDAPGVLVLYHAACHDGFGAAYAAWRALGDTAEYQPVHHGDRVAETQLRGRSVYVLDFSFPPGPLAEMAQHAKHITLLDHHRSAADDWLNVPPPSNVDLLFDMDRSGAQIAWDHFHPGMTRPALIEHIGDRDLWRFALPDTRPVCAGLGLLPMDFAVWHSVQSRLPALTEKGHTVLEVLQAQVDSAMEKDLRTVALCGHQGLASNAINNTSELGHALALRSGTFGLIFFVKGDDVICSLRSVAPFDVASIARHYGGGGHAQAAGFRIAVARFFTEIWRSPIK